MIDYPSSISSSSISSLYLIGDSILDNSYWPENGNSKYRVSRNCTGNLLTDNMPDIVKDLSTEEITADNLRICIKHKIAFKVGHQYVKHRNSINYPYSDTSGNPNNGKVYVCPTMKPNDVVFISAGGNDVILGNFKDRLIHAIQTNNQQLINYLLSTQTKEIINNLRYCIQYYKSQKCKVVFIIPYKPIKNTPLYNMVCIACNCYDTFKTKIMALIDELNIDSIDLSDWSDEFKVGDNIPEPSILGAKDLAIKIQDKYNYLNEC